MSMKKVRPIRYYNQAGHLIGYADENYAFIQEVDASGERIGYRNTYGEAWGTLA